MRPTYVVLATAVTGLAAGASCVSLEGLSGVVPGDGGGPGDAALDGASDAPHDATTDTAHGDATGDATNDAGGDAGDATVESSADAGPCNVANNLLDSYDPSFELPGCAGWSVNTTATAATSNVALCGNYSCQVCATGNSPAFGLYFTFPVLPGEQYVFSGWILGDPDGGSDNVQAFWAADPNGSGFGTPILTSSTWQEVTSLIVIDDGGVDISNVFYADYNDPGIPSCFLVDNAALVRVKDAGP